MKSSRSIIERLEEENHKRNKELREANKAAHGCPEYFIKDPNWNNEDFDFSKLKHIAEADNATRQSKAFYNLGSLRNLTLITVFSSFSTLFLTRKSSHCSAFKFSCIYTGVVAPTMAIIFCSEYENQPKITLKEIKSTFNPKLYSTSSLDDNHWDGTRCE